MMKKYIDSYDFLSYDVIVTETFREGRKEYAVCDITGNVKGCSR